MDDAIRTLIRRKLHDGRLPLNSLSRFWGGPADGEVCDVCDKPITKQQLVLQGIASLDKKPILFHVLCFELWNDERHQPHAQTA
jgi:hypothetical protein